MKNTLNYLASLGAALILIYAVSPSKENCNLDISQNNINTLSKVVDSNRQSMPYSASNIQKRTDLEKG